MVLCTTFLQHGLVKKFTSKADSCRLPRGAASTDLTPRRSQSHGMALHPDSLLTRARPAASRAYGVPWTHTSVTPGVLQILHLRTRAACQPKVGLIGRR